VIPAKTEKVSPVSTTKDKPCADVTSTILSPFARFGAGAKSTCKADPLTVESPRMSGRRPQDAASLAPCAIKLRRSQSRCDARTCAEDGRVRYHHSARPPGVRKHTFPGAGGHESKSCINHSEIGYDKAARNRASLVVSCWDGPPLPIHGTGDACPERLMAGVPKTREKPH
jgi:hypothetical protein